MGRKSGFRSGEMFSHSAKVRERHVITSINLPASTFDLNAAQTLLSGTNVQLTSGSFGYMFAWQNTESSKVSNTFIVPSNVTESAKANINIYWAGFSGVASGGVVLDADYRIVCVLKSGTFAVTGLNYLTSGANSNATVNHSLVSGANREHITKLQKSTITIPSGDLRADSLVLMSLYRDVAETYDSLTQNVAVLAVEVEFVEG